MTHPLDGVVLKKRTGYQERIMTVSCKNREAAAIFVGETLLKSAPGEILQLTIATQQDESVVCSVLTATTSYSDTSLEIA